MTIVKGNIGNALHSVAPDHIVATADEIFDEALGQYQNEINQSAGAFDISEYNKSGDTPATYATLALALAGVPSTQQKGGMTIKYIDSTTSKYVQYRLTATAWSTTTADWQGVDDEPMVGSANLVKSGGVADNYARKDGTYDTLGVGVAKDLMGADEREFSGETFSHNGLFVINKIKGRTLLWNQLAMFNNEPKNITYDNSASSSAATHGTGLKFVKNTRGSVTEGHKHLTVFDYTLNAGNAVSGYSYIYYYQNAYNSDNPLMKEDLKQPAGNYRQIKICRLDLSSSASQTQNLGCYMRVAAGDKIDVTISNYMSIDLTLMFGEGNEPEDAETALSSIEKYIGSLNYYDIQQVPSILSVLVTSLNVPGTGVVPMSIGTLTGKLNGQGESVVVFPDGLNSIGTTHDEINSTYAVKRIGKRAYVAGDESNSNVITDMTNTMYVLATEQEYVLDNFPLPLSLSSTGTAIFSPVNTASPSVTYPTLTVTASFGATTRISNLENNRVSVNAQTFTDAQKAQARSNINAANKDNTDITDTELAKFSDVITSLSEYTFTASTERQSCDIDITNKGGKISITTAGNLRVAVRLYAGSSNVYDSGWVSELSEFDYSSYNATRLNLFFRLSGGGDITEEFVLANITNLKITRITDVSDEIDTRIADSRKDIISSVGYEQPASYYDMFEPGGIAISNSGWSYSASTTRIRTKEGLTIRLYTGDKIECTRNVSGNTFYTGIRNVSTGAYSTQSWANSYTATFECDVVICVNNSGNPVEWWTDRLQITRAAGALQPRLNESRVSGRGGQVYYGDKIDLRCLTRNFCIKNNYLNHYYAVDGVQSDGFYTYLNQSLAIYNGRIFAFSDVSQRGVSGYDTVIIDYATKEIIAKANLNGSTGAGHSNNAQFINGYFYDAEDTYPLLLISRGDYSSDDVRFYLIRVQEAESEGEYTFTFTTVKTIKIDSTYAPARYNASAAIDTLTNKFVVWSNATASWTTEEGNWSVLTEFDLADIGITDFTESIVTLTASDVQDRFDLDYFVFQGGCCAGGKLFLGIQNMKKINQQFTPLLNGTYSNQSMCIVVINLATGTIESVVPSGPIENEGVCLYDNKLFVSSHIGNATASTTSPCFSIDSFAF